MPLSAVNWPCREVDYDGKNGRPVALCFAGGDDLQALMVSAGMAWAFIKYTRDYAKQEAEAKGDRLGIHNARLGAVLGLAGKRKRTSLGRLKHHAA